MKELIKHLMLVNGVLLAAGCVGDILQSLGRKNILRSVSREHPRKASFGWKQRLSQVKVVLACYLSPQEAEAGGSEAGG